MARLKSASYDDQKQAIEHRAAELFAQRGYHGTSMNDVAQACGLSKPALYHYYRDKDELLTHIAEGHVARLVTLVESVEADSAVQPVDRLEVLITRFLHEYAGAQNAHRVLTEDVKFLPQAQRDRVLAMERRVVQGFADAAAAFRPELQAANLQKVVAMLLFGMLNWMFTWMRSDGALTHASIAPVVCDLLFKGLGEMRIPEGAGGPRSA
jgi:AcrR family transcriptional regulator